MFLVIQPLAYVAFEPLLHGVALAFGLVIPLGPQNLFVFTQGANNSRFLNVIPVIVTAAICDTTLILLGVAGVSGAVFQLSFLRVGLLGVGVVFLLYIGWMTWKSQPATSEEPTYDDRRAISAQVAFACSISLLNPHAILDTVAVIGTNSLVYGGSDKVCFATAAIGVSWVWFLALAIAGRLIGRLSRIRAWLNRVSALLMWTTAGYLLTQF